MKYIKDNKIIWTSKFRFVNLKAKNKKHIRSESKRMTEKKNKYIKSNFDIIFENGGSAKLKLNIESNNFIEKRSFFANELTKFTNIREVRY